MTNKELARKMVIAYFNSLSIDGSLNAKGFSEMLCVKSDDSILLEHINAWINILNDAKAEIIKEKQ